MSNPAGDGSRGGQERRTSGAVEQPPSKRARTVSANNRDTPAPVSMTSTPAGSAAASRSQTPASRGFLNPFPQGDLAGAISALNRGAGIAGRGGAPLPSGRQSNTRTMALGGFARMAAVGAHAPGGTAPGATSMEGARLDLSGGMALSSKAITDQFVGVRTQIEVLKEQLKDVNVAHDGEVGRLTQNLDHMANNVGVLTGEVQTYGERLHIVENALHVALERLALTENRLEEVVKGTRPAAPEEALSTKAKNALQSAVRLCLRAFMEITDSEDLPQPLANGQFWEATTLINPKTHEEVPARRLRPQWERSWPDNEEAWLRDIIHRIQKNGSDYANHDFSMVTYEQMKRAIERVWKTFLKNWANQNASQAKKDAKMLLAKKNQRKMNKAKGRRAVVMRGLVPKLQEPRYAHLLQWQYTSTDESEEEEVEGVIDPQSEEDEASGVAGTSGIHRRTTRKVWVAHPAAYMPDESTALLKDADVYVEQDRIKKAKASKGNAHIPRIRGSRRERSMLPSLRGATVNRHLIPRSLVRPEWLLTEEGRVQDNGMYMVMNDGEIGELGPGEKADDKGGEGQDDEVGEGGGDE